MTPRSRQLTDAGRVGTPLHEGLHTVAITSSLPSTPSMRLCRHRRSRFFFFNDTATTEIYPLPLHDALPISGSRGRRGGDRSATPGDGRRDRLGRVRARAPRVGRAGGQRTELAVRPSVRRRRDSGVSPHARRSRAARRAGVRRARRRHRDGLRGERRAGLPLRRARPVTIAALVHVVVSGLATGSIYALVALSLVIVYNPTRTLNFAQGEMLMVSTFAGFTVYAHVKLPLVVVMLIAVAAAALLGWVIERVIIRHAIGATHLDVLIITLGLSLVLRSAAGLAWTHDDFPFPSFFGTRPIVLGPVRVAPVSLGIIGASLALMLGLWALFTRTRLGRAMRAVAQNQRAARLVGISVERRSEEHTSELQSRLHLVCRLLLEKKKNQTQLQSTPPQRSPAQLQKVHNCTPPPENHSQP